MNDDLHVTQAVTLPASELSWTAVRSGGPGGQNVNKVATKVELRFDLSHTRVLDAAARARLLSAAAGRLDADGKLLITCDTTRSQSQNLELARRRLAELVRAALITPKRRRPTRPTRASERRRIETKRKTSEKKSGRRGSWE